MNIALTFVAFILFFMWIFLYVIYRQRFLIRFVEFVIAFFLALFMKKIGLADELAYVGLGLSIMLLYFIK